MEKILLKIFFLVNIVISFTACSDMNDKHDMWMEDGERIYIGKIDSLKVFPGNERVKLRFWASDPRAKSVGFYWVPDNDSMLVDLNKTSSIDSFEVFIGGPGSTKQIAEANYTLSIITRDDAGHNSIPFEKIINVYGENFRSTLTHRVLKSKEYNDPTGSLSLRYSGPVNEKEIGIKIRYTDRSGVAKSEVFSSASIPDPLVLTYIDPAKTVSYSTLFLPDPLAIDTFYTDPFVVAIENIINVALGKSATGSDFLEAKYVATNAVDGIVSSDSRWVSSNAGEHWIEVDLGQEYAIHSFRTLVGSGTSYTNPVKEFSFQAEVNGVWETIISVNDNTDPQFKRDFPEVNTRKVRYFVPDYASNMVRMFELEVYATIRYGI